MGHTYSRDLHHIVWSTKERKPLPADLLPRLWPYMGGIARKNGLHALEIGGMRDHAHMLLLLPPDTSVSKAVQLIKGGSSKWMHIEAPAIDWQEGFASFSVSASQEQAIIRYIREQEKHHAKRSFEEEFIALLKKHRVEYDPRYVFG